MQSEANDYNVQHEGQRGPRETPGNTRKRKGRSRPTLHVRHNCVVMVSITPILMI